MEPPTEDDCCHSDCKNCILDVYQQQLTGKSVKPPGYVNTLMCQTRYKPFKLVKIEDNTPHSKIYTFVCETSDEKFLFHPGSHAVLRNCPETEAEEHLSRPYTLIPWDSECQSFSVLIKLYQEGKMSGHIAKWELGAVSNWRGLYTDFTYEANSWKHLVMICMGTGIAPMFALSKHITDNENDETIIHLLYGSSTPEEIHLRREVAQLSSFWNFRCTHFISRGFRDDQVKYNEKFVRGKIQDEHVANFVTELGENSVLCLICGSDDFNSQISEVLKRKGMTEKQIHIFG